MFAYYYVALYLFIFFFYLREGREKSQKSLKAKRFR
jgi:hypothetical protein